MCLSVSKMHLTKPLNMFGKKICAPDLLTYSEAIAGKPRLKRLQNGGVYGSGKHFHCLLVEECVVLVPSLEGGTVFR